MMTKTDSKQHEIVAVLLEDLVPQDHILRKIDHVLDLRFVYDYVEHLYSRTGRPSIDPVVLIKLAFIDKLFGYHSMRRTLQEAQVNVAIRWYLGYGIEEKLPHFSDFSKTYTRKFSQRIDIKNKQGKIVRQDTIFAVIFDQVLQIAMDKNYLQPQHVYMDSTHIKAHANKKKVSRHVVQEERKEYQDQLDEEIDRACAIHGYNQPKPMVLKEKQVRYSERDKECGVFQKGEHETQLAYLAQTACDIHGFVLEVDIDAANKHDSSTFRKTYEKVVNKYGVAKEKGIRSIGLDAGYKTPAIAKQILEDAITPLLPYTRPKGKKYNEEAATKMGKREFTYDKVSDVFICPNKEVLTPRGIQRSTGYVLYRSEIKNCRKCPMKEKCLSKSSKTKSVVRHLWQWALEEVELIRHTSYHKQYYPMRSKTIERVFADAKEKHGMRFTRVKGKQKVLDETRIIFSMMNIKKIAQWACKSI